MDAEYIYFERLINLRKEKGKTISDMAYESGLSASTISNYERGVRIPDGKALMKLAEYFDCTADYLLGLSNVKNIDVLDSVNISIEEIEKAINIIIIENTDMTKEIATLMRFIRGLLHFDGNKAFGRKLIILLTNILFIVNDLSRTQKEDTDKPNFENQIENFFMIKLTALNTLSALDNMFEEKFKESYPQVSKNYSLEALTKFVEDRQAILKEGETT